MIPAFTSSGLLPKGIHDASWAEVSQRFGDTSRRKELLIGLLSACYALRDANVAYLFLDGSFVTSKRTPGDWDACYSKRGISVTALDPVFLDFSNERAAQKAKYGGEAFFAETSATGQLGQPYLDFFQREKNTGRPKGLVRLDLGTLP